MTGDSTGIQLLTWKFVKKHPARFDLKEDIIHLPEKVVQFGTGILLRGLVDYLIDKANKKNCFNGTVLLIKSTGSNVDEFKKQDNLYTVIEKGIHNGEAIEQNTIITCISRVLPAPQNWSAILESAANPAIEIAVSNTTEVGIVFQEENIHEGVPKSFPAKLTAYLWRRYKTFDGDKEKGMIILATELLSNNGQILKEFVLRHASRNELPGEFSDWVTYNNQFCNTLVDRIVPGKSAKDDIIRDGNLEYTDHLHTTVEPYLLWAIEGNDLVKQKLSFIACDNRALITSSIEGYKEQKLRILNGSNTIVMAPAYLSGLNTVYDSVTDSLFANFTQQVIDQEILPTIIEDFPTARSFARDVMDRFRNPFINYPLLNVALQCSGKMNNRNADTIIRYYNKFQAYPPLMSIGFASFFLFYTPAGKENEAWFGMRNNERYLFRDEHTAFLCSTLQGIDWHNIELGEKAISVILNNDKIFSTGLASLPGLVKMLASFCHRLFTEGLRGTIEQHLNSSK